MESNETSAEYSENDRLAGITSRATASITILVMGAVDISWG